MNKGSIGYILNGNYLAQYCENNAQFELLGEDVVDFLRLVQTFDGGIDKLKSKLMGIDLVDNSTEFPEKRHLEKYSGFYQGNINNNKKVDWFTLLNKLQGVGWFVAVMDDKIEHMVDGTDFGNDWRHCAYAYIIDFDENLFRVYVGLDKRHGTYPFNTETIACREIASFPIEDIPLTWVAVCDELIKQGK